VQYIARFAIHSLAQWQYQIINKPVYRGSRFLQYGPNIFGDEAQGIHIAVLCQLETALPLDFKRVSLRKIQRAIDRRRGEFGASVWFCTATMELYDGCVITLEIVTLLQWLHGHDDRLGNENRQ